MRIDAAVGFIDRSRFRYPWLAELPAHMNRDFTPAQLETILTRNRFNYCVAAPLLDDPAEVDWLLSIAATHPFLRGVLGAATPAAWDRWQRQTPFCGVVIAADLDMAREAVRRGLSIETADLASALLFAESFPEARLALAHLGRPSWRAEDFHSWRQAVDRLAGAPNVHVKLSALLGGSSPVPRRAAVCRPWIQHLLTAFGPDRLMYGSDWPRCMCFGTWKEHLAAFTQAMGAQTQAFRDKILGETALSFYGLKAGPQSPPH